MTLKKQKFAGALQNQNCKKNKNAQKLVLVGKHVNI